MMENGTRLVDVIESITFSLFQVLQLSICDNHCVALSPAAGHIQPGEEEVPTGCGWHQGPGWSIDQ